MLYRVDFSIYAFYDAVSLYASLRQMVCRFIVFNKGMFMSLAIVYTRAKLGVDAPLVTVEVHLSNGLPSLSIVGLPETAVKESKDRVRSAILNSHLEFPARRITINLAPADLPKDGGRYDLAIALGILAASGQLPREMLSGYEFLGELALSGELRSIAGTLPAALTCKQHHRKLIVGAANATEAALSGADVFGAHTLLAVCAHLQDREHLSLTPIPDITALSQSTLDILDVKGQWQAKRALEIAAAGGHNLLLYGPPGTGKTMLASRLPGLLPPLNHHELLEVAAIHSVAMQEKTQELHFRRPFRAPHHTSSAIALVGGGSSPRPGEISLAHGGVLFLDEVPEFSRTVLEVLREPLENGEVRISRARAQLTFPARFQLIAAMNPCPCGYQGSALRACRCSPDQIKRYRDRLSGPLLDRIDMHIHVNNLREGELQDIRKGDSSDVIRERVTQSRARQIARQGKINARLSAPEIDQYCPMEPDDQRFLEQAITALGLSTRAYHRVIKLARTLADLQSRDNLTRTDLTEALSYRTLDRAREMA